MVQTVESRPSLYLVCQGRLFKFLNGCGFHNICDLEVLQMSQL